jgi:hypothetical protein
VARVLAFLLLFQPTVAKSGELDCVVWLVQFLRNKTLPVRRAEMKVGFNPDQFTFAGWFDRNGVAPGYFTERQSLDGNSVWVSALDGSYQARTAYRVTTDGTLDIKNLQVEGASQGRDAANALMVRIVQKHPETRQIRIGISLPGVRYAWSKEGSQAAIQFAQDVREGGGAALEQLPEVVAINNLGFKVDVEKSGLSNLAGEIVQFVVSAKK